MSLFSLALRNLAGTAFRSTVVALCVFVVGSLTLFSAIVFEGAEDSLGRATERLGADVVVLPQGVATKVETALLTGKPTSSWMPSSTLDAVSAVPGVGAASPQLFLESLSNASCCAVSEMFLIVFDPKTDFTVQPWLERKLGHPLGLGEAVGGSYVFVPEGSDFVMLYGYFLTLKGNLDPTGTGIDQTMFVDKATAAEMARISVHRAEKPLVIPTDSISAVMVRVSPGADPHQVADTIDRQVPGATALESTSLFRTVREHLAVLSHSLTAILTLTWAVAVILIGLVLGMAANERRREIAILRALGSSQVATFQSLLLEALLLALGGGLLGLALTAAVVYLFAGLISRTLAIPFLFPDPLALARLIAAGIVPPLLVVILAASVPAALLGLQEPAAAMRE